MPSERTKTTTDHDEIRRWAEERGGVPAEVTSTERDGETGIIRIDFPGYSGAGSLKQISWDEWFVKFDQSNLALLYQDETADGQRSNFNEIVGRETAQARSQGDDKAPRRSLRGRAGGSRGGARSKERGVATAARRKSASGRTARGAGRKARRAGGAAASREAPRAAVGRVTGRGRGKGGARSATSSRRTGGTSRGRKAAGGRTAGRKAPSRGGTRRARSR